MNKKILDALLTVVFCASLVIATNIEDTNHAPQTVSELTGAEDSGVATAGVSRVLSQYSFTTESDEKTGITKKDVVIVTSSFEETSEVITESHKSENEVSEQTKLSEQEEKDEVMMQPTYQNRWNITLTQEEIDLLAKIVWLEANGEPIEGQEAVVEVIFNRIASELYPDILYDVLSQKNPVQFCSWKNREIAEPTEKEYQSIMNVLEGNTNILRNDTLYFSTEPLTSRLDVKIGGHSFCY